MRRVGVLAGMIGLAVVGVAAGQVRGKGGLLLQPGVGAGPRAALGPFGYDVGDLTSQTLTGKAWKALERRDHAAVAYYAKWCLGLYEEEAKAEQASLSALPPTGRVHEYATLNDVGTSLFILGESLRLERRAAEAEAVFHWVIREFGFAQCWDPRGWFWKVADASAIRLQVLNESRGTDGRDGQTATGS